MKAKRRLLANVQAKISFTVTCADAAAATTVTTARKQIQQQAGAVAKASGKSPAVVNAAKADGAKTCMTKGTYYDTKMSECQVCKGNTYQDQAQQSSCKKCGTVAGTQILLQVTGKSAGHHNNKAYCKNPVKACKKGQYFAVWQSGKTGKCQTCKSGKYSDANGQTTCESCTSGLKTYGNSIDAHNGADDCKLNCAGSYGAFGGCSGTCGVGVVKSHKYKVTTAAKGQGKRCPVQDGFVEAKPCSYVACPPPPPPPPAPTQQLKSTSSARGVLPTMCLALLATLLVFLH